MAAYPEVGEAVVWWETVPQGDGDAVESSWARLSEDERAVLNRRRVEQRARVQVRRYAVRNKLTRLVTLTYRCVACSLDPCGCGERLGPGDRQTVKRHVNRFLVALREALGVEGLPYVYVVERGTKRTRRLHVHLLLSVDVDLEAFGELVDEDTRAGGVWAHGRVNMRDRPQGSSMREQARSAARYLAKYVSKALGDEDPEWAHSYERSQGYNVRQAGRRRLPVLADVLDLACVLLGVSLGELEWSWCDDWEEWFGPPTAVARLN